jgi:hypothetical protein
MTADHVIDDPREPTITPLGVLDHRGKMLLRVTVPIKQKMGFHTFIQPEPDEVETILPEDMLAVSDIGVGIAHLEPHEVDGPDDDEDDEPGEAPQVRLSEVIRSLTAQGIVVIDDGEEG